MRIQIESLLVPLRDMQCDFGIAPLARQLLRRMHEARADSLPTPVFEHGERIDIPFIILRLPFQPASHGGVEPCLVSPAKAQHQPDHFGALLCDLDVVIAKAIAIPTEGVRQMLDPPTCMVHRQRIGDWSIRIGRVEEDRRYFSVGGLCWSDVYGITHRVSGATRGDCHLVLRAESLRVAHRRGAEEAFVLPIEVRGVMVPHAKSRTGRVEVFAQQQAPGLLEPHLLLELQRTHGRDGLEVVVQRRDAHPQLARKLLDAQGPVEISTQALNRLGDAGGIASSDHKVTEPGALRSDQEPVDNFPRDQRQQDPRVGRAIQEPDQPHHGVQQVHIQRADGDGPHISKSWRRRGMTGLHHDCADEGGGEFQAETEVGSLLRGFEDLADAGQLDGREQIVCGVIAVAALAQQDLLASLGNHAQRRLEHTMNWLQRRGGAG